MIRQLHRSLWCGLLSALAFASTAVAQEARKPFVIDDVYRIQDLGTVFRFSPGGQMLAFIVKRPVNSELTKHYIFSNDRSDIWLFDRATGTTRNLTEGAKDQTDFWYPAWSPSGHQLAMVSTRNAQGGHSRVWIWDRASKQLTQLSDLSAGIDNDAGASDADFKIHWLSDSQLVFPATPATLPPAEPRTNRQLIRNLTERWNVSLQGAEPAATTFESGQALQRQQIERGQSFVSCDVVTRQCEQVMQSYLYSQAHEYLGTTTAPSPTTDLVATVAIAGLPLRDPAHALSRYTGNVYEIDFYDKKGQRRFESMQRMGNVSPSSLRWSPDGRRLAFVGSFDQGADLSDGKQCRDPSRYGVYVLDSRTGRLEAVKTPSLRPKSQKYWGFFCRYQLAWADNRQLLLAAEQVTAPSQSAAEVIEDGWWLVDTAAAPRNITAKLEFVPEHLYPASEAGSWLFARDNNLWSLSASGSVRKLTSHEENSQRALNVVWMDGDVNRGGRVSRLVYDLGDRGPATLVKNVETAKALYYFDVRQAKSQSLPTPGAEATFFGFSAIDNEAVLVENDRTGTRAWLSPAGAAAPRKIFEANTFLNDIAEGEVRSFDYTSLRGEPLKAWLILPIDYRPGQRYPMVTWVYQSEMQRERPRLTSISMLNPLNLQTLASRGYAVLMPSMPGKIHEYPRLTSGVLPAIDKVVEMGIADPQRLAVMGQSNGGFSTYGLITQTNRFKAAIALAGMTDLSAIAMQFEGDYFAPYSVEVGLTYGRFDLLESRLEFGLPWNSFAHYRNSPISHVDAVQTPLLQLHGDHDGVPIAQAQEFFIAMQRLGKRARFVQYTGDDHVLQSPANVRHSWEQIFEWLQEYLK